MNIHLISTYCIALIAVLSAVPLVLGESNDGEGSEDGSGDSGSGDDDDFFNFEDETKWSDYAIYPKKCINYQNEDVIVFEIYGKGHNQCKKKSVGTYQASIPSFVKAYTKQVENDAELSGQGFDLSDDAMDLLQCSEHYYNGVQMYVKLGCRRNTGKGFQIYGYSDEDCTQPTEMEYSVNVDISTLRVSFDSCRNCVSWPSNQDDDAAPVYDDGFYYEHDYDSPLCSAAWYYKAECNGRCQRLAKQSYQVNNNRGFSAFGKFLLFVCSLLGIFMLLAVLAQRKKMSQEDALVEESAVKSVGLQMKYLPRIVLGLIVFIALLMLLQLRTLTWIFLLGTDGFLFGYWSYLKYRAEGHVTIGGFQLYSDDDHSLS